MLNGKLALHDVEDVSAFCQSIIARSKLTLSYHEREDLHAYLIATAWELSLRFDGAQGSRFSAYAKRFCSARVVDWQRSPHRGGRTKWQFAGAVYERERPNFVPYDDSLGELERGGAVDDETDRLAASAWLLGAAGSADAPSPPGLDRGAAGRAAA